MTLRNFIKSAHGYHSLGIYDANGKLLCRDGCEATIQDFIEWEDFEVSSFVLGAYDEEIKTKGDGTTYMAKRIRMCVYLTFNSDNQSCGG